MSDYVTEAIFLEEVPNLDLVKEEVEIEEDQDTNVIVKKESTESHKNGQSPDSFPLHPTEAYFNCDVDGQFSREVCEKKFEYRSEIVKHSEESHHKCADKTKADSIKHIDINDPTEVTFYKVMVHENKGGFRCEVCGCKFLYQYRLNDHMNRHSKQRKHKCNDCDYAAKTKADLVQHTKTVHPTETPYQCQVCSKSFAILSLLKKHSASHNEDKLFQCDQCSTTYKSRDSLRKHKAAVHENEGEVCGNKYLCQSRLNERMVKHNEEKKHNCSDCDYSAKSKGDLTVHIRKRHPTETLYQCQVCSKSYLTLWLLRRHSVSHNEEKSFKCDQCPGTFKSTKNLKYHKVLAHGGGGKFNCKVCGMNILFKGKYERHILTHSDEKSHKCGECGSAFKSKWGLNKHVLVNHPTETPFQCKVCSKSFATLKLLNSHSMNHSGEKPFKCDQCYEAFKLKSSLKNHKVLVHDGGGKFPCGVCGIKFLSQVKLNKHMVRHSTKRDFKCSVCEYAAKREVDLKKHMGTHIIERNHKCGGCGSAFKTKLALNSHFKVVHRTKTVFQCEVCLTGFAALSLLKAHSLNHGPREPSNSVTEFEEIDLKVEPSVIYDPEETRDISNMS